MVAETLVDEISELYPLLYFASHTSHSRSDDLTERDLRLLTHIGTEGCPSASGLARHLGIARSTMSEAIRSLEIRGLLIRERTGSSRRPIHLTTEGLEAIRSDEGLDRRVISQIMNELSASQQNTVLNAFRLIAQAIRTRQR